MRHNVKKGLKLGTDASHTKAMKKAFLRPSSRTTASRPPRPALRPFAVRSDHHLGQEGRPALSSSGYRQARR